MKRFIILLAIFTATVVNSQDKVNYLKCNHSTNCFCMEHNEVEIQCPQFEPQIYLRITPNNQVHFDCENVTNKEYELIPHYNLDVASFLSVSKCPLMPATPILNSYLNNIKINLIRTIQFVSSGVNRGVELEAKHFEGFYNVSRFDLRGNEEEFEHLPSDLFENMTNIRWLRIRVPKIQLPANLLLPLKNVESLELGHNKIETIPPGFFRNQQKLKHLIFWGNNLRNLSKDSFVGLESVEDLDLSANGLETLDADLLKPLKNLTEINLSSNNLIALPKGLFSENKMLRSFKLLENRIIMLTLPNGLFANLIHLKEVSIKCGLTTLPEDLFAGATNIESIWMESNHINALPDKIFAGLEQLKKIDLSYNLITALSEETFKDTTSLESIKLSRNRIKVIPNRTFFSLAMLKELHMDDNNIDEIGNTAFSGLDNVDFISLKNNSLNLTSSPFQGLKTLYSLDLSNNKIKRMFDDFTLEKLKVLDLKQNNIESFDMYDLQSFYNRDGLSIDLSYNEIESVNLNNKLDNPEGIGNIKINLNENPFKCDCSNWEFLKYVMDINSKIKFTVDRLDCASPGMLRSQAFNSVNPMDLVCLLDNSDITEKKYCPKGCICLNRPEDKTLLMNCTSPFNLYNATVHSHLTFTSTELRIESCSSDDLPTITSPLYQKVNRLYLTNLNITKIGIINLPRNLELLDLSNNNISSMNKSEIEFIKSLPLKDYSLGLENNLVKCDCKNQVYVAFLKHMESQHKLRNYSDLECIDGTKLETLETGSLCKQNYLFMMVLCIIMAIMGIIIGTLAALYYKYQKQIKMWLYAHDLCLWFVTEAELDKDKKFDAFVSYSHRDEDFVNDYLVPELEQGSTKYKLCVHVRDWAPGVEISTQISNSVNDAKRTIIIMSPNYLQSNWAQWEFRVAQSHAATEKRSRIIIVLYGDIGDINKLEPDIRDYLKLNTYVKWGDKWFWEKLKYAMPHVKPSERSEKTNKGLVKSTITSSVDDKLELIKPISVTPPQLTTPPAEKFGNPLISTLNAKNLAKNNQMNGYNGNGHINGAYVINTSSSRQSDV